MKAICPHCAKGYQNAQGICPRCGGALERVEPESLVGQEVDGKYMITKSLGRSSTGHVYRARHHASSSDVAVKVFRRERLREKEAVARFYREVRIVSQLSHSNIVTIYDFGDAGDGQLYIAMELLEGETLAQLLRAHSSLALERAVHITAQVADALAEAHGKGVVHRDINPSNVMLVEELGEPDHAKVLDFGVAKILAPDDDRPLTTQTQIAGAAAFLSPEQIRSLHLDGRADLYGLGMVFFTLLCGKPAFRGADVVTTLMKHITEPIPRLAKINPQVSHPDAVDVFFRRALAKDPAQRFANAAEFKAGLLALLDVTAATALENTVTDARSSAAPPLGDDEETQRYDMRHVILGAGEGGEGEAVEGEETERIDVSGLLTSVVDD